MTLTSRLSSQQKLARLAVEAQNLKKLNDPKKSSSEFNQ